tara:strand:+ start:8835 stop:9653 length:819 start_codon:yes stop_codon:yes gene_type:complete
MKVKIFKISKKLSITGSQKKFYSKNGFIIFRNLFSKKEARNIDKKIAYFANDGWHNIMNPDRIEFLISQCEKKFNQQKTLNDKVNFMEKAIKTSKSFRSFLIDKRVRRILESLIKKKFVGLMTHVIFKHANTKYAKLAWVPHQDNSYAKMKNNGYITTNLFLHKANKKNGCLYLYPGTHRKGLVNFKKFYSYHAKSNQKPGNRVNLKFEKLEKIDLNINEGDFLVMDGNLIHGSYGNYSKSRSRHMLSFNYGVKGQKFNPGFTAKRKSIPIQ